MVDLTVKTNSITIIYISKIHGICTTCVVEFRHKYMPKINSC